MADHKYLYFPGCRMAPSLPQYDLSIRKIASMLQIDLVDMELNCCGYPVRHIDMSAAFLSAARIMAVAKERKLPILTPCKCCFGNLKQANYWLQKRPEIAAKISLLLETEGLSWRPGVTIHHLLSVLSLPDFKHTVTKNIVAPLAGLRVAAHYGCHALRPSDVTQFDNPLAPKIFETLIALTGATPVEWPLRLECCGHPLQEKNQRLSVALMTRKLNDANAAGAMVLATACTYCQIQFEEGFLHSGKTEVPTMALPSVLFSQLLGLAMGVAPGSLGVDTKIADSILNR